MKKIFCLDTSVMIKLLKQVCNFSSLFFFNLVLLIVNLTCSSFKQTEIGFEVETHEQLYNKSCWLLGLNQFAEAEKVLHQAETVCKNFFADDPDFTDDEKEAELSVIRYGGDCLSCLLRFIIFVFEVVSFFGWI